MYASKKRKNRAYVDIAEARLFGVVFFFVHMAFFVCKRAKKWYTFTFFARKAVTATTINICLLVEAPCGGRRAF